MQSNTSTPRSLSPIPEGRKPSLENNMEIESKRAMNRQVSPVIESSAFSSESDSDDNDSIFRAKKKKTKARPSVEVLETKNLPPSRNNINRNNNSYYTNSNTSTLIYNSNPLPPVNKKKSFLSKLCWWKKNKKNEELALPVTATTKDKKKKKKQRKCCLILLIIIILLLLGNLIALDVIYLRSPILQAQNITTLVNTANTQNLRAEVCMTLLGTLPPKEFSCTNCSDDQSFYNVTTFCVLKTLWANSINITSIETDLRWMQDTNFCGWGGIKCDDSNNIIELELGLPNVPRTFDNGLGKLKTLRRLAISGSGQLPNGVIPSSIFQLENLVEFALISTGLTGPIPNTFDKMTSLKTLKIVNNLQLSSPIPDTISLTSLTTLSYSIQNVNGVIPDFIGNSESLQNSLENLDLSTNKFTGNIPSSLMNLLKLKSLNLGGNLLTGVIPPYFTSSKFVKSLITLDLSSNGFSGTIPVTLTQFENLVNLALQKNAFTGQIPSELSSLKSLSDLFLNDNKLTGNIPNSIGTMNLNKLLLSGNTLTGVVPNNICQRRFQSCDLGRNQLTIPATCGVCIFG